MIDPDADGGAGEGTVAAVEAGYEALERVFASGPWVAAVESVLGLGPGGYKVQASVICSRPGAPAGRWHADSPHSKHSFGGESGRPRGVCVFVPLVPLEAPVWGEEGVRHGLGCTVRATFRLSPLPLPLCLWQPLILAWILASLEHNLWS